MTYLAALWGTLQLGVTRDRGTRLEAYRALRDQCVFPLDGAQQGGSRIVYAEASEQVRIQDVYMHVKHWALALRKRA